MPDKSNDSNNRDDSSRSHALAGSLLPCPFCGEQPEFLPQAESAAHPGNYWPDQIVHNCKSIGVNICVRANGSKAPEKVFEMWNTRTEVNGERKILRNACMFCILIFGVGTTGFAYCLHPAAGFFSVALFAWWVGRTIASVLKETDPANTD